MKVAWIGLALALALLVETLLGLLAPAYSLAFDPFLLVVVYVGLTRGEVAGMLTGAVAGWIQEVAFGGTVLGLLAMTRIFLGFGVGAAGSRLLLASPLARILVLAAATVADGWTFSWLASVFDVRTAPLRAATLATRAGVNALVGTAIFQALDRRLKRELRR